MGNLTRRNKEKVELTAVSITGEPKKLKAEITYQQQLTIGQYIGIGISSVAACGLGWYFGRMASKCKDSKLVKTLDRMFGIENEEEYDEKYSENVEYVDIEVDEE